MAVPMCTCAKQRSGAAREAWRSAAVWREGPGLRLAGRDAEEHSDPPRGERAHEPDRRHLHGGPENRPRRPLRFVRAHRRRGRHPRWRPTSKPPGGRRGTETGPAERASRGARRHPRRATNRKAWRRSARSEAELLRHHHGDPDVGVRRDRVDDPVQQVAVEALLPVESRISARSRVGHGRVRDGTRARVRRDRRRPRRGSTCRPRPPWRSSRRTRSRARRRG